MKTQRQQFLHDLNNAFANSNTQFMLDHVSDDFEWRIVGTDVISGKAAYAEALKEMVSPEPLRFKIHSVITHGTEASVSGVMFITDEHYIEFCDVMKFKSAGSNLITRMTSYAIEIKPKA
jgi:ketosteroid isomerase-like protein